MSSVMLLAKTLPAAILETILARLALLFLTGAAGDMTAARQAAAQMLAAYHPETEDELRLAASIVGFSFQALEALGQAATQDMPLTRVLRLRGSAVTLNREANKAQNRLDQLRKTRREAVPAPTRSETVVSVRAEQTAQPEPAQPEPAQLEAARREPIQREPAQATQRVEKALDLIADTNTVAAAAKANGLTWTQAYEQRQRDARIAASLKRAEARIVAQGVIAAAAHAAVTPPGA
jgi:hypothetical protein